MKQSTGFLARKLLPITLAMGICKRRYKESEEGFTIIELMIVVVIIAILAAVAVVAYTKHVKKSRMVAERGFISDILAQQESYNQRFGQYCDGTGGTNAVGTKYPALLAAGEPQPHAWQPHSGGDNRPELLQLGAHPKGNVTFFTWAIEASDPASSHALYGQASSLGLPTPANPHPWFYVVGQGDLDGDGTAGTTMYVTSVSSQIVTLNEGY